MGRWEMVRLGDVISITSGGTPKKDIDEYYVNGNIPWVKTGDLKCKYVTKTEDNITNFGLQNSSAKLFPVGTLLVAMYGATIGACSILKIEAATNQACAALLPAVEFKNLYLFYYFTFIKEKLVSLGVGGAQPNISGMIIKNLILPKPPIQTQHQIADVLDRASALIEKRKAQIDKLDLLVKSQFVEMFGDPVTNPMGWEMKPLGECGLLKNGMNYTRRDSGYNVRCIGVGDFGNLYRIDNIYGISEISLSARPAPDYFLQDGDIVFVRSNGNKKLVGRSVEIFLGKEEVTFSGFCIRYRNAISDLLTVYLNHIFHLPAMKAALLSDGRGANIQNVNQQALSNLMIPIPPIDLQNRFAAFVEVADKSKFEMRGELAKLDMLYKSLMQKCFRGEIYDE